MKKVKKEKERGKKKSWTYTVIQITHAIYLHEFIRMRRVTGCKVSPVSGGIVVLLNK